MTRIPGQLAGNIDNLNHHLYCLHMFTEAEILPSHDAVVFDEAHTLEDIAAGGRTLALFTSYGAMRGAAEAVRETTGLRIYCQGDLPNRELIGRFAAEEESCLFATMTMWQGVDVPGRSLSLVVVDRIPFPRPDEPLMVARRKRLEPHAFREFDAAGLGEHVSGDASDLFGEP